jgi:hypothetical protein
MRTLKENIPETVSNLLDGRFVRWAASLFEYDGHDRTLEVFDVPVKNQLEMLRKIRPERKALEEAAGGPLVIIFHARKPTLSEAPMRDCVVEIGESKAHREGSGMEP